SPAVLGGEGDGAVVRLGVPQASDQRPPCDAGDAPRRVRAQRAGGVPRLPALRASLRLGRGRVGYGRTCGVVGCHVGAVGGGRAGGVGGGGGDRVRGLGGGRRGGHPPGGVAPPGTAAAG